MKNKVGLKIVLSCFSTLFLSGCNEILISLPNQYFEKAIDPYVNYLGAQYLKNQLIENCGTEDSICIQTVENQFDTCHFTYEKEWVDYLDSSSRNEDKLLKVYSTNLYNCITDEEGNPFFEYNLDSPNEL